MNDYKFISYRPVKDDQFLEGIATVCVANRFILKFGCKKTKDGGTFFAPASYNYKAEDGQKQYVPAFQCNNRAEDEPLMDFVREGVKQWHAQRSAFSSTSSMPLPKAVDSNANANPFATSMKEVADDGHIPF